MMYTKELIDVAIIGGGPAGCMTAKSILDQKKDAKVLIIEEHPDIGVPVCCGGGISKFALDENDIELPEKCIANKVLRIYVYYPNSKARWKHGFVRRNGYVLHRDRFDKYIAYLARKLGCVINRGERMETIAREGGNWLVKTDKGEYLAKIVVGADGPSSRVAELAKINSPESFKSWRKKYVVGLEYEVSGVYADSLDFYFDAKEAPEGYFWVFPKAENSAKIGIVASGVKDLKDKLVKFINANFKDAKILEETKVAGTIPGGGSLEKTYGPGIVIVGDAAGQVNPIYYGGIHAALTCGRLAGIAIAEAIEKNDFSEESMSRYEALWKGLKTTNGKYYAFSDPSLLKAKEIIKESGNTELEIMGNLLDNKDITALGYKKYILAVKAMLHVRSTKKFKEILEILKAFHISKEYGW